jgi:hypothetical protein
VSAITLLNDFHGTAATMRPRGGRISARAWRRAMRRLCPSPGCTCGAIRGSQPGPEIVLHECPDGSRLVARPS